MPCLFESRHQEIESRVELQRLNQADSRYAIWLDTRKQIQARLRVFGFSGHADTALIGEFEASDSESGSQLLKAVCIFLQQEGIRTIKGPVNGNTWHNYRLAVVEKEYASPAFLGEPVNPGYYHACFENAGFRVAAEYESRINAAVKAIPVSGKLEQRLLDRGIVFSHLDLQHYEADIQEIYHVSEQAFSENYLYIPISFSDFKKLYMPLKNRLDPEFVILARHGRCCVGFVFAYPDAVGEKQGAGKRLVLKTLASIGAGRINAVGAVLVSRLETLAFQKGYTQVIHALMHVNNSSKKVSARHNSGMFRRYLLYGKTLV